MKELSDCFVCVVHMMPDSLDWPRMRTIT